MANAKLEGVVAAMVTPMTMDADAVDEAATIRLVDRLIQSGIHGLLACGGTGEFFTLTNAERRRMTELVVGAARDRVPVVAHTAALSTAEAVGLSKHAEKSGASAVMVAPPYYEPLNWIEVLAHYRAIASAVDIPIMIYNIPGATGFEFTPAQIGELASVDGIDYVKDSSANAVAFTELVQRYGDQIGVFNGWDSLTFNGLVAGTPGCVWGAASFMPELCVELFETCRRADLTEARSVWRRIWPICNFLETDRYIAGVKGGCDLIGEPAGPPRPPLLTLDEGAKERLERLLLDAGVIAGVPTR